MASRKKQEAGKCLPVSFAKQGPDPTGLKGHHLLRSTCAIIVHNLCKWLRINIVPIISLVIFMYFRRRRRLARGHLMKA